MNRESLIGILFPRRCPVCDGIVKPPGRLICPGCFGRLSPVRPPVCKKCGKEIIDAAAEYCVDCIRRGRSFEYGVALLNYDETARRSMARIKYSNRREYLDFYGAALAARHEKTIRRMNADAIVPVPLHSSRMRQRGFNQAEVMARILGERLGVPVMPDLLVRDRKTQPQKDLTARERLKNLSGAIRAGKIPDGIRTVLLTDDIYTTGSTVEACTRALMKAGIGKVYFAVICITGGR